MKQYDELVSAIDTLLGPNGCPWDREQTLYSVRNDLYEEACELIDAIETQNSPHIIEELGDVTFLAVFYSRLAQKQGIGTLEEVLDSIKQKLIRRHPHVFEKNTNLTPDEVVEQWHEIKKGEKGKQDRKSVLDRIPKSLPALARAHEVIRKIRKKNPAWAPSYSTKLEIDNEEELGEALLYLVLKAHEKGWNAEHALRRTLSRHEDAFRAIEQNYE